MKVLFAASEALPFAMSGGLADVSGALPKALRRRLIGCRVIMPLYSTISEDRTKIRVTDGQARKIIYKYSKCNNVPEFQKLNDKQRDKYIEKFRKKDCL